MDMLKRLFLLALGLLGSLTLANAKTEIKSDSLTLQASGNRALLVQDENFASLTPGSSETWYNKRVLNLVWLKMRYLDPAQMEQSLDVKVVVRSTQYLWNGTDFDTPSRIDTLHVTYHNQAGTDKDISVLKLEGGYGLEVEIVNIISQTASGNFPLNLELKAEIQAERFYPLLSSIPDKSTLRHSNDLLPKGELLIEWDEIAGAEWYDLEWTWVNNYRDGNTLTMSNVSLPLNNFKNNSTRVSVKKNAYAIPLMYESGYILYRIRAVGKSPADNYSSYLAGKWSAADNLGTVEIFNQAYGHVFELSSGHEPNLNWQRTTSFAEEGKNKVAVSYFDGSLRNRQVVSKINTENKTIVGETIYDHQGRGAVQVLPVPTQDSVIRFYPYFNLSDSSTASNSIPYRYVHFEIDENCTIGAGGMSTLEGASRYYSPENPDKEGHQAYLPDAQKYPFTHIEYTPDNTGRIRRQSGVGPDHQLGSGHDTKYFYAKPDQVELDRLFASDAGKAKHYKKNMVVDANGQVSISYLDPQGRVVATALAGEAPGAVDALDSNSSDSLQIDLLDITPSEPRGANNTKKTNNGLVSMEFSQERTVSTEGTRTFHYSVHQNKLAFDACVTNSVPSNEPFCYGCVLDLEVTLSDDCNEELLKDTNGSGGRIYRRIGTFDTLGCSETDFAEEWQSTIPLKVGNYSLAKKLTLNKTALDNYTRHYLNNAECLLTYEDFLRTEMARVDTIVCEESCEGCREALERDYPVPAPDDAEYNERLQYCESLCGIENAKCERSFRAMLKDVSPHGQYGLLLEESPNTGDDDTIRLDVSSAAFAPANHFLSVFNTGNRLPKFVHRNGVKSYISQTDYRNPATPYLDGDGMVSHIPVLRIVSIENGVEVISYDPAVAPSNIYTENDGSLYTIPEHLNLNDFVNYWQSSWASSLVYYHPEYPLYLQCIANTPANLYIDDFMASDFQDAQANGYLLNDITNLPSDPFFNGSVNIHLGPNGPTVTDYRNAMEVNLNNYTGDYAIWEMAYSMAKCPENNYLSQCGTSTDCARGGTIEDDSVWAKYKPLYYSLRQFYEEDYQIRKSVRGGYYNACIGNDLFSPFEDSYITEYTENDLDDWGWNYRKFLYLNYFSLCNARDKDLYAEKNPRFPLNKTLQQDDFLLGEYCASTDTIFKSYNCPERAARVQEEGQEKHYYNILKDCGQCPLVWNMEKMLDGIIKNDQTGLRDTFALNCSTNPEFVGYGPLLQQAIGFTSPGATNWQFLNVQTEQQSEGVWIHTVSSLITNGTESCPVTLKFSLDQAQLDMDKLTAICCLHYTPIAGHEGYSFGFSYRYLQPRSFNGTVDKEFKGEGWTSCVKLDSCYFPPVCNITEVGYDLQDLMNAITFEFEAGKNLTSSSIDLGIAPYPYFIEEGLKERLGLLNKGWKHENWNYNADTTLQVLQMNFQIPASDTTAASSFMLELTKEQNDFFFGDIVSFSAIRPDRSKAGLPEQEYSFLINAKVKNSDGTYQIKTLTMLVMQNLELMQCSEAVEVNYHIGN